jgi:predicted ATPase/predicted Ser/Thr protein kinase
MPTIINNRFELDTLIGQGGMGDVYAGHDLRTGERIAVKLLKAGLDSSPETVERFEREAQALARLDHPNIIRLLETGADHGRRYLVMEYAPGGSLADLLKEQARLTVRRVLELAVDLSDALARVHRLGIIHRDIKPANVLLAADGTWRLTDFGIAHFGSRDPITERGEFLGTLPYMSPEACGSDELDARADIWALGVLLFETLSGRRPFDGPHPTAIIAAILNHPTPDLCGIRPDVPPQLTALITHMLVKERAGRLDSIRQVGAAAEALLRGEEPSAPSVTEPAPGLPPVTVQVDPSELAHLEELAKIHKDNIEVLEEQVAHYGVADAPVNKLAELKAEREALQQLKQQMTAVGVPTQVMNAAGVKPPASLPGPVLPVNLPIPPTTLIGRQREVVEAQGLLRRPDVRLLTLTGPAGAGKTRLALELAESMSGEFPDGVGFVDLSPIRDAALVASTIAQALGVQEAGGQSLAAALKAAFRDRCALLLLDNFEQVLDAAPLVADLVASTRQLKVLVSSRAPLRIAAEHEFPVSPLALPDLRRLPPAADLTRYPAVALFVRRAQAVRPAFAVTDANAAAVAAICARLDGLPLAIELAAARTKLLAPQALLQRLDHRLALLTGGLRDSAERHQTLRGAIDWSYDLLGAEERTLFTRLAIFVGGCTIEAIEAVCAEPDLAVLDGVASLVDKSLLRQVEGPDGDTRFSMLETIREYALERLEASGDAATLQQRHAAYYLALAEQAEPELIGASQVRWLTLLRAEHDNLRAALEYLDAPVALRLAGALWRFWYTCGFLSEGRKWLGRALDRCGDAPAPDRARALAGLGGIAWAQGDYPVARGYEDQALQLYHEMEDRQGAARALNILGVIALDLGEYARAQQHYTESTALFQTLNDRWGLASALSNLGVAFQYQHDYVQAQTYYHQSLDLRRGLGDRRGIAITLGNLAEVALLQGDCPQASGWFRESFGLRRGLGDDEGTAYCLEGLAGVAAALGDPLRAACLWGAAEALREATGAPMPPAERAQSEAAVGAARGASDAAAFAAAWADGRSLTPEQALDAALSEAELSLNRSV